MTDRYTTEFRLDALKPEGEILCVWQCNDCGSVVSDTRTHDGFHNQLDAHLGIRGLAR